MPLCLSLPDSSVGRLSRGWRGAFQHAYRPQRSSSRLLFPEQGLDVQGRVAEHERAAGGSDEERGGAHAQGVSSKRAGRPHWDRRDSARSRRRTGPRVERTYPPDTRDRHRHLLSRAILQRLHVFCAGPGNRVRVRVLRGQRSRGHLRTCASGRGMDVACRCGGAHVADQTRDQVGLDAGGCPGQVQLLSARAHLRNLVGAAQGHYHHRGLYRHAPAPQPPSIQGRGRARHWRRDLHGARRRRPRMGTRVRRLRRHPQHNHRRAAVIRFARRKFHEVFWLRLCKAEAA
mmetsp:Transcript_39717/g.94135  ORF Transcript_39717/g.94135 Transcript_39717/m.94135 type:complete len:288 (-) Transcript_39717:195-1058(-)